MLRIISVRILSKVKVSISEILTRTVKIYDIQSIHMSLYYSLCQIESVLKKA